MAGISGKNNFQSKDFQYFNDDNYRKYDYPRCCDISDVPQVSGFDVLGLYEGHDYEKAHEPEDNEHLKIERPGKKYED